MARFTSRLAVPKSAEETFAFVSAFERTAEWDPGIREAQRLTEGPIALGTRFRVVAAFFGQPVEMFYTVAELEAPRRILFRGEAGNVVSEDEITVVPSQGPEAGCTLTWDARLTPKGWMRIADPLLQLAFQWIGRKAVEGLARALNARPLA
jgi:hypothetical protein